MRVAVTGVIVKFKGAISCYLAPFYKTKKASEVNLKINVPVLLL